MKVISSAFLASLLLFVSCGRRELPERGVGDQPVLSPVVQAETETRIEFARHVKPILEQRCAWCHDGSENVPYSLVTRQEAFQNERIVPRKPEESLFFLAAGEHPDLEETVIQVAVSDLKVLERWIVSGAVWPSGEAGQLKRR